MSRKIIDYKIVSAGTADGIGLIAAPLIRDGWEPSPNTKIEVTYTPTYVFPGSATTLGGYPTYMREFIKYSDDDKE